MGKRFVVVWFRYLTTDWFCLRQPSLRNAPLLISAPSHGRMMVTAANALAQMQGIDVGITVADARALLPSIQVLDDIPGITAKLLNRLAEWCIRFTPIVAADLPDGLIMDVTGCSHLWGGDHAYVIEITKRLNARGYDVRVAMADSIGAAWAIARFGKQSLIIEKDQHAEALMPLPPAALRLDMDIIERLHKLGLHQLSNLIGMPRAALRRRFGPSVITRLSQALGHTEEIIKPVIPMQLCQERLQCFDPITTAAGIEMALLRLLEALCTRLRREEKGLRTSIFKCYRIDGKLVQIDIGTNRPSHNVQHLFKLFEIKIPAIEPDLGIELFVLEAPKVEDHPPSQNDIWEKTSELNNPKLAELLDRFAGNFGSATIHRYLPNESYWPERSYKVAASLTEQSDTTWKIERPRPILLLAKPELIEVTAPIPDYPPMLFRYKGKLHKVIRADGPERIEQEWWLQEGRHRDYYCVEDEEGRRYWLFRSGHYDEARSYKWFIHGFFA